jgi:hypothetical protein
MAKKKEPESKERFEQLGTKISPEMAKVLDSCCNALGVDVYHLLQWFAYTVIRAASPMHALDPRIQKLMIMLESDVGWQKAFNLANPDDLDVAQVVLILEQKNHKGFGAVMIDKPWMGEATRQTECVDDILERVTSVTMSGIYRRLRDVGVKMQCNNLSDILLTMIDDQTTFELDEGFREELPGMGDRADNGRPLEYGKRTKRKKHFTPDSIPTQQHLFDDFDRDAPAPKFEDWEGEQHDR